MPTFNITAPSSASYTCMFCYPKVNINIYKKHICGFFVLFKQTLWHIFLRSCQATKRVNVPTFNIMAPSITSYTYMFRYPKVSKKTSIVNILKLILKFKRNTVYVSASFVLNRSCASSLIIPTILSFKAKYPILASYIHSMHVFVHPNKYHKL